MNWNWYQKVDALTAAGACELKIRSLSVLNKSKIVKKKIKKNFDDARIKKIRKYFNELKDGFFKPKEIRGSLYEIENKNNLSTKKIKEIE